MIRNVACQPNVNMGWRFSRCENQRRAERCKKVPATEGFGPSCGPLLRGPSSRSARTPTSTDGGVQGGTGHRACVDGLPARPGRLSAASPVRIAVRSPELGGKLPPRTGGSPVPPGTASFRFKVADPRLEPTTGRCVRSTRTTGNADWIPKPLDKGTLRLPSGATAAVFRPGNGSSQLRNRGSRLGNRDH